MTNEYSVRSRPYHERCETLAEFNFYIGDDDEDSIDNENNYIYCFCSRVFIRDGIKTYYADNQYPSESDVEVIPDSQSQDWDDQSHVHFSLDTSYKVKCERDDGASCYCSASHTDNCCSTDEHDLANHPGLPHALQPSDSGADLTYQDYHFDSHDKLERMDHDFGTETAESYSEDTFERFWSINGERLIWASWIKTYSDYINPSYLGENNDLLMDENNIPKQHSIDQIYSGETDSSAKLADDEMRERKFSYDSKINPYKKTNTNLNQNELEAVEIGSDTNKDDTWVIIGRRRSCSEQERILSPRTLAGTDSMTNVTKLTFSIASSRVTSDSSPTDDYSVSSASTDDPSNDLTRIANIDDTYDNIDNLEIPSEELDTEQYWQFLWKKHFGEQYALHLAKYNTQHAKLDSDTPAIDLEVVSEESSQINKKFDVEHENTEGIQEMTTGLDVHSHIDYENSESNSQDMPTVIELQNQVNNVKLQDKAKPKTKRNNSNKYMSSVGVLLQNLLNEDNKIVDNAKEFTTGLDVNKHIDNENSQSNSQDMPTFIELQNEVNNVKLEDKAEAKGKKNNSNKYMSSVGVLLQNLLNDSNKIVDNAKESADAKKFEDGPTNSLPKNVLKCDTNYFRNDSEPLDADDKQSKADSNSLQTKTDNSSTNSSNCNKSPSTSINISNHYGDGDDEPPEEEPVWPKKIIDDVLPDHEYEEEQSKIQDTLDIMGFCMDRDKMLKGEVMFRKRVKLLRPPRYKRFSSGRKTYFDEDGNPYSKDQSAKDSQDEREMQTDEDCTEVKSDADITDNVQKELATLISKEEGIDTIQTDLEVATLMSDTIENEWEMTMLSCNEENVQGELVKTSLASLEYDDSCLVEASNVPLPDDDDDEKDAQVCEEKASSVQPKRKRKAQPQCMSEVISAMPEELRDDPKMYKYWKKRHSLFFKFDEGIRLDRESWFSVTPENVARHIAHKYSHDVVLDAFCGAGGNTIQFALNCQKVIAVDIDPHKIELARHNAEVYGVADRIQFIVGDFFEIAHTLQADMVFLSPPWGGPNYSDNQEYDLETMLEPRPLSELIPVARSISDNISVYVPRNSRTDQLLSMAKELGGYVEIEQSYLDRKFIAITAYYFQHYRH